MKVYVVEGTYFHEFSEILKVFTNKDKAHSFAKRTKDNIDDYRNNVVLTNNPPDCWDCVTVEEYELEE